MNEEIHLIVEFTVKCNANRGNQHIDFIQLIGNF